MEWDGAMVTAHSFALENLLPRTTYHCRVTSTNFADLAAASADYTFTTLPPPNHPPVAVAAVSPLFLLSAVDPNHLILAPNHLGAAVTFDGSASSDEDGDVLEFQWFEMDPAEPFASGVRATSVMTAGEHPVTLVVNDGQDTAPNRVSFKVIRPAEAVTLISGLLDAANIAPRNQQPLRASLNAAEAAFDRDNFTAGSNILQAFIHKVQAQITPVNPALAAQLTRLAQQIIGTIAGS